MAQSRASSSPCRNGSDRLFLTRAAPWRIDFRRRCKEALHLCRRVANCTPLPPRSAVLVAGFFSASLFGGKVLSPADVLLVSASFRDSRGRTMEPANRLLMDPVLQFQPWIRVQPRADPPGAAFRSGTTNPVAALLTSPTGRVRSSIHFKYSLTLARFLTLTPGCRPRAPLGGGNRDVPARPVMGFGPWGRLVLGADVPVLRVPRRLAPLPGDQRRRLDALAVLGGGPGPFVGLEVKAVGVLGIVSRPGASWAGTFKLSAHVLLAAGLFVLWQVLRASRRVARNAAGPEADAITGHAAEPGASEPSRVALRGLFWWTASVALGISACGGGSGSARVLSEPEPRLGRSRASGSPLG